MNKECLSRFGCRCSAMRGDIYGLMATYNGAQIIVICSQEAKVAIEDGGWKEVAVMKATASDEYGIKTNGALAIGGRKWRVLATRESVITHEIEMDLQVI